MAKTIKLLFKSLWSNQAAVDNRKMKWYWTLIVLLLSVFLPWIPFLSNGYTADCASCFKASNSEVNTALKSVIHEEEYFSKIGIAKEGDDYVLDYSGLDAYADVSSSDNQWQNEFNGTNSMPLFQGEYLDVSSVIITETSGLPRQTYYFDCVGTDVLVEKTTSNSDGTSTTTTEIERRVYLEMYYFPTLSYSSESLTFLTNFTKQVVLNMDNNGVVNSPYRSYCFFLKDYTEFYFYNYNTTNTNGTTINSNYTYVGDLSQGFRVDEEKTLAYLNRPFVDYITEDNSLSIEDSFTNNFCGLLHEAGRKYALKGVWVNVGVLSACTVCSILISVILVFIFLKKKNSIYRDSNFFHAINISVGMSVTPSLLGLIFGFFMSDYAIMFIIAAHLIRAVYVMNKICPPQYADSSKPVYQARD